MVGQLYAATSTTMSPEALRAREEQRRREAKGVVCTWCRRSIHLMVDDDDGPCPTRACPTPPGYIEETLPARHRRLLIEALNTTVEV